MLKIFEACDIFRYDPGRGRFRDWLGRVVRNQVAEYRRHPSQRVRPRGGDSFAATAKHLYYVMDLADDLTGEPPSAEANYRPATLQSRLQTGALPPQQCLEYAQQLLAGLASLHAAAMVHRDVKPANCLFVHGRLKLADFGLLTEANPQISRVGTQKYMPPDGRMDARADVYATGLLIYEMMTGLPCDSFPHLGEKVSQVATDPSLTALVQLVLTACQPDPKQRFADAGAMLAELKVAESDAEKRPRRTRRRTLPAIAGSALMLAVAVVAITCWPSRPPPVNVNFITDPYEATIYLDNTRLLKADDTPYRTPCTVENLPARPHQVVFQRESLPKLDVGRIDFATTKQVVARWDAQR